MENAHFLECLDKGLNEKNFSSFSKSGLLSQESVIIEKIDELLSSNKEFQKYSRIYQDILDGTEKYFENTVRALSAIVKITQLSENNKGVDLVSLCESILDILSFELEVENSSIMLLDKEHEYLELIAGKGKGDKYLHEKKVKKELRIKVGEGIGGQVAEDGRYVFIEDTAKDKRFSKGGNVSSRALLCAPLISNEEIIGVINFSHPDSKTFDINTIHLLLLFSNFVGQNITLNKMYYQIQHWNEELQKEAEKKTKELKSQNRKLKKISVTDPLTHLFNRRFFFERLEEEFILFTRYNEYFCLLLLDLDNLKPINDTYGHSMGDKVLRALGKTLKKLGRKGDVMGRIGGDEFGYIFMMGKADDAEKFALRLKKEISEIKIKGAPINISISIGLASALDKKFRKPIDIFNAADEALYKAKKTKNTVCAYKKS